MKQTARELFEDNVKYNAKLAKRNAKRKIRHKTRMRVSKAELEAIGRVLRVEPDELVKKLKELGIKISRKTLYNWENAGLIPVATFRNSRRTEYPDEALYEGFASGTLKEKEHLTYKEIKNARELALKEKPEVLYFKGLIEDQEDTIGENTLAWWWLENKIKVCPDLEIPDDIQKLRVKRREARKKEVQRQLNDIGFEKLRKLSEKIEKKEAKAQQEISKE